MQSDTVVILFDGPNVVVVCSVVDVGYSVVEEEEVVVGAVVATVVVADDVVDGTVFVVSAFVFGFPPRQPQTKAKINTLMHNLYMIEHYLA